MRRFTLMVLAVGLLTAACNSAGASQDQPSSVEASPSASTAEGATGAASDVPVPDPILGCVPVCSLAGLSRPGPLSAGPYETQWFFGGEMVLTLVEPWSVNEDSTGELSLSLRSMPDDDLLFWEDVYPTENGVKVRGVPMTVDGLLKWIRSDPRLDVTEPREG